MSTLLAVTTPAVTGMQPPTAPTNLRISSSSDPLDIETHSPRLSWIISSAARGERQTAYHVLAATTPEFLQPGRADLFDSGAGEQDLSLSVAYAGTAPRRGPRGFGSV